MLPKIKISLSESTFYTSTIRRNLIFFNNNLLKPKSVSGSFAAGELYKLADRASFLLNFLNKGKSKSMNGLVSEYWQLFSDNETGHFQQIKTSNRTFLAFSSIIRIIREFSQQAEIYAASERVSGNIGRFYNEKNALSILTMSLIVIYFKIEDSLLKMVDVGKSMDINTEQHQLSLLIERCLNNSLLFQAQFCMGDSNIPSKGSLKTQMALQEFPGFTAIEAVKEFNKSNLPKLQIPSLEIMLKSFGMEIEMIINFMGQITSLRPGKKLKFDKFYVPFRVERELDFLLVSTKSLAHAIKPMIIGLALNNKFEELMLQARLVLSELAPYKNWTRIFGFFENNGYFIETKRESFAPIQRRSDVKKRKATPHLNAVMVAIPERVNIPFDLLKSANMKINEANDLYNKLMAEIAKLKKIATGDVPTLVHKAILSISLFRLMYIGCLLNARDNLQKLVGRQVCLPAANIDKLSENLKNSGLQGLSTAQKMFILAMKNPKEGVVIQLGNHQYNVIMQRSRYFVLFPENILNEEQMQHVLHSIRELNDALLISACHAIIDNLDLYSFDMLSSGFQALLNKNKTVKTAIQVQQEFLGSRVRSIKKQIYNLAQLAFVYEDRPELLKKVLPKFDILISKFEKQKQKFAPGILRTVQRHMAEMNVFRDSLNLLYPVEVHKNMPVNAFGLNFSFNGVSSGLSYDETNKAIVSADVSVSPDSFSGSVLLFKGNPAESKELSLPAGTAVRHISVAMAHNCLATASNMKDLNLFLSSHGKHKRLINALKEIDISSHVIFEAGGWKYLFTHSEGQMKVYTVDDLLVRFVSIPEKHESVFLQVELL